jgi:cytochrome c oxidase assembly protein subunit 15
MPLALTQSPVAAPQKHPVDSIRHAAEDLRPVGVWLLIICGMLLVMIVLGGTTRLTGSGLSIMEWAPVAGFLPPLSQTEWQRLFALYQKIPQYTLLHQGFGIDGFKHIFWLEWLHRLWGRLIGIAFFVPFCWFLWHRHISRTLLWRLAGLFVLGGLQGAVGWFMVASGFEADRTAVSPFRLVAHLSLALILYSALLGTAFSTLRPTQGPAPRWLWLNRLAILLIGCVALTIIAGGFVSGLHAGLIYNTFPLMDGRLVPPSYFALRPWLTNLTSNIAAVQFDHRVLATLTAVTALLIVGYGFAKRPPFAIRAALICVLGTVLLQYMLGVATLIYVVPVPLAASHQASAVLLLSSALFLLHTTRLSRPS